MRAARHRTASLAAARCRGCGMTDVKFADGQQAPNGRHGTRDGDHGHGTDMGRPTRQPLRRRIRGARQHVQFRVRHGGAALRRVALLQRARGRQGAAASGGAAADHSDRRRSRSSRARRRDTGRRDRQPRVPGARHQLCLDQCLRTPCRLQRKARTLSGPSRTRRRRKRRGSSSSRCGRAIAGPTASRLRRKTFVTSGRISPSTRSSARPACRISCWSTGSPRRLRCSMRDGSATAGASPIRASSPPWRSRAIRSSTGRPITSSSSIANMPTGAGSRTPPRSRSLSHGRRCTTGSTT